MGNKNATETINCHWVERTKPAAVEWILFHFLHLLKSEYLPPAYEVRGKVMFSHMSVCVSVHNQEYSRIRNQWGYAPLPGLDRGMPPVWTGSGTPSGLDGGTPVWTGWGYPSSTCSTACGMPLALTHEDFIVQEYFWRPAEIDSTWSKYVSVRQPIHFHEYTDLLANCHVGSIWCGGCIFTRILTKCVQGFVNNTNLTFPAFCRKLTSRGFKSFQ